MPRRLAFITALIVVVTLAIASPSDGRASYVTIDKRDVWVTKGEMGTVADNYAKAALNARVAGGGCSDWAKTTAGAFAQAILYYKKYQVTPFGIVTGLTVKVANLLFSTFSGIDFCDVAVQAANGAAWATYHANQGGGWSWLFVYHETRRFRPDRCHFYNAFATPGRSYNWRVWDLTAGCKGM